MISQGDGGYGRNSDASIGDDDEGWVVRDSGLANSLAAHYICSCEEADADQFVLTPALIGACEAASKALEVENTHQLNAQRADEAAFDDLPRTIALTKDLLEPIFESIGKYKVGNPTQTRRRYKLWHPSFPCRFHNNYAQVIVAGGCSWSLDLGSACDLWCSTWATCLLCVV